jgi:hypothetical protein
MKSLINKQLESILYNAVKSVKEDLEENLKPSLIGRVILACSFIDDPIYEREVVDIGMSTVVFDNGDVVSYHDITHEPEYNILLGSTRDIMDVLTLIYRLPRYEKVFNDYKAYFSNKENKDNQIYRLLKSLEKEGEIELGF